MDAADFFEDTENKVGEQSSADKTLEIVKNCSIEITEVKENVKYLQDLFVRRLNEDKQKNEMIKHLENLSSFALIEPFVSELILILDRIEGNEDDFVQSIGEELLGILQRRGVEKITVTEEFNPAIFKAVKIDETIETDTTKVIQVIRNGYMFSGRVIRPAEVIVAVPKTKM